MVKKNIEFSFEFLDRGQFDELKKLKLDAPSVEFEELTGWCIVCRRRERCDTVTRQECLTLLPAGHIDLKVWKRKV